MKIIEQLKHYVGEEIIQDGNSDVLTENGSLLESGMIDSLGIIQLVSFIEENYQIKIDGEELIQENFETLRSISDMVSRMMEQSN